MLIYLFTMLQRRLFMAECTRDSVHLVWGSVDAAVKQQQFACIKEEVCFQTGIPPVEFFFPKSVEFVSHVNLENVLKGWAF